MACAVFASGSAYGTTKGLNQIVTPDIQPVGELSVSFQAEHASIGNSLQGQLELGITRRFEVALFQGFRPGHTTGAVEYGLVQSKSFLVSTGYFGPWMDDDDQFFLEAGYIWGNDYVIAGAILQNGDCEPLLGWSHRLNPRLSLSTDYQGGSGNFTTAGFTYNLTPNLQVNPALYISNSSPHHVVGYGVISWNVVAWK